MSIKVKPVSKAFAREHLLEIAALRIKVFKDFPYIYDGSVEYEVKYLDRYFKAPNGTFILAIDENNGNKIVGVATALPLTEEDDFVKKPFLDLGKKIDEFFYFGESILLPEYRGQGLGHAFFDEREKVALSFSQIKFTTFCAVERPVDHPLKPANYQPLDEFWQKRGYQRHSQLTSKFEWLDIGESHETEKNMKYWIKSWNR
ncbi:GNAT family N-acetyltransferase [Pseudobdellovibrio sp. HCB154]|uniref:GNAT family N-acetyltransferase n=1 Tax=Pseudobdellovibrio sp. HCB154 TaxID=3386277 RepID=UPI0039171832